MESNGRRLLFPTTPMMLPSLFPIYSPTLPPLPIFEAEKKAGGKEEKKGRVHSLPGNLGRE